jgi:hypothetical protein
MNHDVCTSRQSGCPHTTLPEHTFARYGSPVVVPFLRIIEEEWEEVKDEKYNFFGVTLTNFINFFGKSDERSHLVDESLMSVFHAVATHSILMDGGDTLRADACMVAAFLASEWIGMGGRVPFLVAFARFNDSRIIPFAVFKKIDDFLEKRASTDERMVLFVASQVPCNCLLAHTVEAKKCKKGADKKRREMCCWCGKVELNVNLKCCARCQLRAYCSKKCQRNHWKAKHKSECHQRRKGSL